MLPYNPLLFLACVERMHRQERLSRPLFSVCAFLVVHCDSRGELRLNSRDVAALCGISYSRFSEYTNDLIGLGLLQITRSRNKGNRYQLQMPEEFTFGDLQNELPKLFTGALIVPVRV